MKQKKMGKKLELKKLTISHLDADEMLSVLGAMVTGVESCVTHLCMSVCNSICIPCFSVNFTCKPACP